MLDQGAAILSLIGVLVLFAAVLFLAWYCTKWLGMHYGASGTGGKIQILDRCILGTDRTLVVARIEGQVWLLGVTAQHIEKIDELDPALYPVADGNSTAAGMNLGSFSETLGRLMNRGTDTTEKKEADNDED